MAPVGYHIPADAEWTVLTDYLVDDASTKIKSEPEYETKIRYVEQGGYHESKWVPCNTCYYWTEKQKANNPCTACRNQRGKLINTGKYIPKTKRKIEEKYKIGWDGTNESGFSGLPGGYRYWYALFNYVGKGGYWWSSTGDSTYDDSAWCRKLYSIKGRVGRGIEIKGYGCYVRCIKD